MPGSFIMDRFLLQQLSKKRNIVMMIIGLAITSALYEIVSSKWLAMVGIVYLAYHISDLLKKFLTNSLPKPLIDNTSDKAVLITGCDTGFGQKLAIKLDGMGFKVYAGCLNIQGDGAKHLKYSCSERLILIPLDVTKPEEVDAAYQLVLSSLQERKLWALVNNAGVTCSSEIEWCPVETFQRMIDVNTVGVIRVTKAFLPLLRNSEGRIVIVASMAGRVTVPGFTPYSMSKFAVVAFADGLRREMIKWRVSVHMIEPSAYKTNVTLLEPLYESLTKYWSQCSEKVLSDYGSDYLEQFKVCLAEHMEGAKPKEKISEVVDDMVDAVAGTEPKLRYVPGIDSQFSLRMLVSMPIEMQDHVLNQYSPKTIPRVIKKDN